MVEMSMRVRLAEKARAAFVDETGGFGDEDDRKVSLLIADAVLEALREPDEGMIRAANDWYPGDDPDFVEQWQKAIDHARNDGKE